MDQKIVRKVFSKITKVLELDELEVLPRDHFPFSLMLKSRLNFPTETLAIIVTGVRCSLEHALYIKSSDLDIYLTILAKIDKF